MSFPECSCVHLQALCPERKAMFGSQTAPREPAIPQEIKMKEAASVEILPSHRWCITAALCYKHHLELLHVQQGEK